MYKIIKILKNEEGFIASSSIIIVFILSLSVSSLILLEYSYLKKIESHKNQLIIDSEVELLIQDFTQSVQKLKEDDFDWDYSQNRLNLIDEYKKYNIKINDCSTGINPVFMAEKIKSNSDVQYLLQNEAGSVITNYGWINPLTADNDLISQVLLSYEKKDIAEVFPLVNNMPVNNVYYMTESLLSVYLKMFLKEYPEKTKQLLNLVDCGEACEESLNKIINTPKKTTLSALIGVKTSFWRVELDYKNRHVSLVYGAVPKEIIDTGKIDRYVLVERCTSILESI